MRHPDWSRRLAAAFLVATLGAGHAFAGSITINMTATVHYDNEVFGLDLKVSNSGDEPAQSVTAVVRFGAAEARGKRHETLAPNGKFDESFTIPAVLTEGRWPFRVAVDYTDANQYPFQALHAAFVTVGSPEPAKIAVSKIDIPPMSTAGTVRLRVKNLAGVARSATATLFVPGDMEATEAPPTIELAPWEEKDVRLGIVNRTALAGSRYPVFVAIEYVDTGVHQTVIAQQIVEIRAARAWLSGALLWVAGLLVLGWLVLVASRGMRRARVAS